MRTTLFSIVVAAAVVGGCDRGDAPTATPADDRVDRDNTAVNTRDRDATTRTADQQGQSRSDVDIAAEIRRKVVDTKMSVNAQNAKIIVNGGSVLLRGPVKSQEEKDAVGRLAAEVVGAGNVDNQLEVEVNN